VSEDVLREAIAAMAQSGVKAMNQFVVKHGGDLSKRIKVDANGYIDEEGDAAHILMRERDLLREVAHLAARITS